MQSSIVISTTASYKISVGYNMRRTCHWIWPINNIVMKILYYTKNEDDTNNIYITIMSSLLYNTFQTWLVISFCRITSMFVLIVDFMVKLFNIVDGSCCFDAIWAVLAVLAGFYFLFIFIYICKAAVKFKLSGTKQLIQW